MMSSSPKKLDQTQRTPVDMSPQAISRRLKECSAISALCVRLTQAKIMGRVEDLKRANAPDGRDTEVPN